MNTTKGCFGIVAVGTSCVFMGCMYQTSNTTVRQAPPPQQQAAPVASVPPPSTPTPPQKKPVSVTPVARKPNWQMFSPRADDSSCTTFGDYCIEIWCPVRNIGLVPGRATVTITLFPQSGKRPLQSTGVIDVGVGQVVYPYQMFRDATVTETYRASCEVN